RPPRPAASGTGHATSPPPSAPLPPLPGIDTAAGLARAGGNAATYVGLLRRFATGQRRTADEIRRAIGRGERTQAERLAHTIKGLAGTIGADAMAETALRLERAISGSGGRDAIEAGIAELEAGLGEIASMIADRLPGPPPPGRPDPAGPGAGNGEGGPKPDAAHLNAARLNAVCLRLRDLLAEDDARARTLAGENAPLLEEAFPVEIPAIRNAIDRFDYESALAALEEAMESHAVAQ
ncbi:MAG: Hpt domain-containing protein, partial [Telmatospirillum sp.]|nr:Hpt domain-containing protein [Telmatospirillum sp.]